MIRRFGLRREPIDESDGLDEVRERVLLADRVALERPAFKAFDTLFRFGVR